MNHRAIKSSPREMATFLAASGVGKTFCLDSVQYITAPTREAYEKAGRKEEKEKIADYLKFGVLAPLKEILGKKKLTEADMLKLLTKIRPLLDKLQQAAKDYYEVRPSFI